MVEQTLISTKEAYRRINEPLAWTNFGRVRMEDLMEDRATQRNRNGFGKRSLKVAHRLCVTVSR